MNRNVMNRNLKLFSLFLLSILFACQGLDTKRSSFNEEHTPDKPRDRADIPEEFTWRLTDLYSSTKTWTEAYQALVETIPTIRQWEGKSCDSPETLKMVLDKIDTLEEELEKLYVYAQLSHDLDNRTPEVKQLLTKIVALGQHFRQASSWLPPEILAQPEQELEKLHFHPILKTYRHHLDNLIRLRQYVVDPQLETVLAEIDPVLAGPGNIYGTFMTEFPPPIYSTEKGHRIELSIDAYRRFRASTDLEERKGAGAIFLSPFMAFRRTFAAAYSAHLESHNFQRKIRNYKSCLESALFRENLPLLLHTHLIDRVHTCLPSFHRYLKLRKKLLGVSQLHYYDLYAPLIETPAKRYSWQDAKNLVLAAVTPLGKKYRQTMIFGLDPANRWIDRYPSKNKCRENYSVGIYGSHPFILLNFKGDRQSVHNLARQMGRALHSHFANQNQPHPTAGSAPLISRLAAEFNGELLTRLLLRKASNDREKLHTLFQSLDNYCQTVFKQTLLAEFEHLAHKITEEEKLVTADSLNSLYLKLLQLYHGHDKGVTQVDGIYACEWTHIPHLYYNFHLFQSAPAAVAATALAENITHHGEKAGRAYLAALAKGGSDYPMAILRQAGVNLSGKEPYNLSHQVFLERLEQAEKIVEKLGL